MTMYNNPHNLNVNNISFKKIMFAEFSANGEGGTPHPRILLIFPTKRNQKLGYIQLCQNPL